MCTCTLSFRECHQTLCLRTIRDSFLNNSNGSSDELEGPGVSFMATSQAKETQIM